MTATCRPWAGGGASLQSESSSSSLSDFEPRPRVALKGAGPLEAERGTALEEPAQSQGTSGADAQLEPGRWVDPLIVVMDL